MKIFQLLEVVEESLRMEEKVVEEAPKNAEDFERLSEHQRHAEDPILYQAALVPIVQAAQATYCRRSSAVYSGHDSVLVTKHLGLCKYRIQLFNTAQEEALELRDLGGISPRREIEVAGTLAYRRFTSGRAPQLLWRELRWNPDDWRWSSLIVDQEGKTCHPS